MGGADKRGERGGPPADVRLGPRTKLVVFEAEWAGTNCFPSCQASADEFEKLLNFADRQGQLARFLPRLRARWGQFESAKAELRVAFHLHRTGLPVADWEPAGAGNSRGEFTVKGPHGRPVFVEVKRPGWEGELTEDERRAGAQKLPKHVQDGRAVGPWLEVQKAIDRAYGKFDPARPNLLVLADNLFWSPLDGSDLFAHYALYLPRTEGRFSDRRCANLGAVTFFGTVPNSDPVSYKAVTFTNPNALPTAALPADVSAALNATALEA